MEGLEELTKQDAKRLESMAVEIEAKSTLATRHHFEIARLLYEARELLIGCGCRGAYGNWVEVRVGYTRQHVARLVNVHAVFGSEPHRDRFDISACVLLSSEDNRDIAEAALELAKRGHFISHAKAKEMVESRREQLSLPAPHEPQSAGDQPSQDEAIDAEFESVGVDQPDENDPPLEHMTNGGWVDPSYTPESDRPNADYPADPQRPTQRNPDPEPNEIGEMLARWDEILQRHEDERSQVAAWITAETQPSHRVVFADHVSMSAEPTAESIRRLASGMRTND